MVRRPMISATLRQQILELDGQRCARGDHSSLVLEQAVSKAGG
jgi:hypothetical protein